MPNHRDKKGLDVTYLGMSPCIFSTSPRDAFKHANKIAACIQEMFANRAKRTKIPKGEKLDVYFSPNKPEWFQLRSYLLESELVKLVIEPHDANIRVGLQCYSCCKLHFSVNIIVSDLGFERLTTKTRELKTN